jgi:hypothetical protein
VQTGLRGGDLMARALGRPRRRWEDNIKMDIQEVGWGGMDRIAVAHSRDT